MSAGVRLAGLGHFRIGGLGIRLPSRLAAAPPRANHAKHPDQGHQEQRHDRGDRGPGDQHANGLPPALVAGDVDRPADPDADEDEAGDNPNNEPGIGERLAARAP